MTCACAYSSMIRGASAASVPIWNGPAGTATMSGSRVLMRGSPICSSDAPAARRCLSAVPESSSTPTSAVR